MYYLRPTKKKIKIKTQKNNNNKKLKYKTHNIIQIVCGTEGHITVYGPVCHPQNIIWTEANIGPADL